MFTKKIECPKCKNKIDVNGNPGEKIQITCSNCNTKGVFTFPRDISTPQIMMSSGAAAIEVKNLVKIYNGIKAVDKISFEVKKGEIFGFLGPNGAGKTTTIKSILNLIQTDLGEIKINGISVKKNEREAKKYIGYLPEKVAFYDGLTALQNLQFYAELKNSSKDECKKLIEEFGLKDAVDKKVGKFSKGMTQRLGMARAILGSPPILILDEPAGGLDPAGVKLVREKIKEMRDKGSTVFVSSHILKEIQDLCDRVGIINKGTIVAEDSVSNLSTKLKLKPMLVIELEKVSDEIIKSVKIVEGVEDVKVVGVMLHILCDSKAKSKIIVAVEKAGGNIKNLTTAEPSLEEVFMKFTTEVQK